MRSDLTISAICGTPGATLSVVHVYSVIHGCSTYDPHHPDYGWAHVSHQRIGQLTGLPPRTIARAVKWLEAAKFLTVRRARTADGRAAVNWYWLMGVAPAIPTDPLHRRPRRTSTRRPAPPPDQVPPVAHGAPHAKSVHHHVPNNDRTICQSFGTDSEIQNSEIHVSEIPSPAARNGDEPEVEVHTTNGTNGNRRRSKVTWLTPYYDDWVARFGGEPPSGQLSRDLKPLHDQHGEADCRARWRSALAACEPRFCNGLASRFRASYGSWPHYAGQAPVDGNGNGNGRRGKMRDIIDATARAGDAWLEFMKTNPTGDPSHA